MLRDHNEYYYILDFPDIEDDLLKICLGILGYLYVSRRKGNIGFVPTRFIQPLKTKAKTDLMGYLIVHGYLEQYKKYVKGDSSLEDNTVMFITKRGVPVKVGDVKRGYKQLPYLYKILNKLLELDRVELKDKKMTRWIDEHLHCLNNTSFNHYNHTYRHLQISLPDEDFTRLSPRDRIKFESLATSRELKSYYIPWFGSDTSTGNHRNPFTNHKKLIRYTNIEEPIEIGLKDCKYLIIADQLYKTFGDNDLSAYYFRNKHTKIKHPKIEKVIRYKWVRGEDGQILWDDKGLWRKEAVMKVNPKIKNYFSEQDQVALFGSPDAPDLRIYVVPLSEPYKQKDPYGYDLTDEMLFQDLDSAIFGWGRNKEFWELFPTANELLYKIKKGVYFERFCERLRYIIFKSDVRLKLPKEHPAFKRGQIYYVLISLVRYMRTAEIMNDVFQRLKKCGVQFIPLLDSVAVAGEKKNLTEYIFNDVCRNHISKELHYEIFIRDLKEEATPIEKIQGLTVEEIYKPKLFDGDNVPLF